MRRYLRLLAKTLLGFLLLAVVVAAGLVTWLVMRDLPLKELPSADALRAQIADAGICSSLPGTRWRGTRAYVPLAAIPATVRDAALAEAEPNFYRRGAFWPLIDIPMMLAKIAVTPVGSRLVDGNGFGQLSHAMARCFAFDKQFCPPWPNTASMCFMTLMYRIERDFPKDAIFEHYLNDTYFGRQTTGVAAAAASYFNKSLADLTLEEAAFLAVLPRGPNNYTGQYIERGKERRNLILDRMAAAGWIAAGQAAAAKARPVVLHVSPLP
jgi:penicillin-binding protein 1A